MSPIARSVVLLSVLLAGRPASAAEFYLAASAFDATMPDGKVVPMWGFASCDAAFSACGVPSSPGPVLRVPDGEPRPTTLTVHLKNDLGVAVSLVIPSQPAALSPTWTTDGAGRRRVVSMTRETAPGTVGVYSWTDLRPGTHLYQSGTRPQVQVQMGLLGAVVMNHAPGSAYPSVQHDAEQVVVFSEIDPRLHAAVKDGSYGTAAFPSTIDYRPTYFLVNGKPFFTGRPPLAAGTKGNRVLLRLANGGLQSLAPQLLGGHLSLVAEDGHALPFPQLRTGALLPAGGTVDALFTPRSSGTFALYDRFLEVTTAQATGGGYFVQLAVEAPTTTTSGRTVAIGPDGLPQPTAAPSAGPTLDHNGPHGSSGCSTAGRGSPTAPVLLAGLLLLLGVARRRRGLRP